MSNLILINEKEVSFEVQNGQVFATSLDVAKVFDKNHRDILAKIAELPQDDFTERNFPLSEYKDNSGKTNKMHNLTRDGFSMLVMGFTGTKAYQWKIQFIDAFNKMEEHIKAQPKFTLPTTFSEALRLLADTAEEKEKALLLLEEQRPKVNLANAIIGTTSNLDFDTFAKVISDNNGIKIGRNRLMEWMRNNGYLMHNNKPYQQYIDRGLLMLKEGTYINQATNETVSYTQPRVTGKGQIYFTNILLDEFARVGA